MASGDTKTEALLNILGHGGSIEGITGSGNTKTQDYLVDAIDRLQGIENEVEELKNNPDVVDIVDTYADLQAYDTQHLSDNDIIRVLADETHSGNSTYYKFNKQADTWTFIGEIAGGGGSAEYVDLTLTGVSQQGISVTASKYLDEVLDMAENNKNVIFRVTLPSNMGYPTKGTYEMPLFNWDKTSGKAISMAVVELGGTVYSISFGYYMVSPPADFHYNTGLIEVSIIPTGGDESNVFYISRSDYDFDSQAFYVYKTPEISASAAKLTVGELCDIVGGGKELSFVLVDVPETSESYREMIKPTNLTLPTEFTSAKLALDGISFRFFDYLGNIRIMSTQTNVLSDPASFSIHGD